MDKIIKLDEKMFLDLLLVLGDYNFSKAKEVRALSIDSQTDRRARAFDREMINSLRIDLEIGMGLYEYILNNMGAWNVDSDQKES